MVGDKTSFKNRKKLFTKCIDQKSEMGNRSPTIGNRNRNRLTEIFQVVVIVVVIDFLTFSTFRLRLASNNLYKKAKFIKKYKIYFNIKINFQI